MYDSPKHIVSTDDLGNMVKKYDESKFNFWKEK
jgi:hypothetical protein